MRGLDGSKKTMGGATGSREEVMLAPPSQG